MDRELFEQMYQEQAPWDTGRPQPDIIRLSGRYSAKSTGGMGRILLSMPPSSHNAH